MLWNSARRAIAMLWFGSRTVAESSATATAEIRSLEQRIQEQEIELYEATLALQKSALLNEQLRSRTVTENPAIAAAETRLLELRIQEQEIELYETRLALQKAALLNEQLRRLLIEAEERSGSLGKGDEARGERL